MGKIELSEKAKAARAQYMRDYRKRNPEREAATKARYWERKAAQIQATADEEKEGQTSDGGY